MVWLDEHRRVSEFERLSFTKLHVKQYWTRSVQWPKKKQIKVDICRINVHILASKSFLSRTTIY